MTAISMWRENFAGQNFRNFRCGLASTSESLVCVVVTAYFSSVEKVLILLAPCLRRPQRRTCWKSQLAMGNKAAISNCRPTSAAEHAVTATIQQ